MLELDNGFLSWNLRHCLQQFLDLRALLCQRNPRSSLVEVVMGLPLFHRCHTLLLFWDTHWTVLGYDLHDITALCGRDSCPPLLAPWKMIYLELKMSRKTEFEPIETLKPTVSLLVTICLLKVVMVTLWNRVITGTLVSVMLTPIIWLLVSLTCRLRVCISPLMSKFSCWISDCHWDVTWRWSLWDEIGWVPREWNEWP